MLVGQPKSFGPGSFLDVWVPKMIDLSELAQYIVTSLFFGDHFTKIWLFACYLVMGKGKSFKIEFLGTKFWRFGKKYTSPRFPGRASLCLVHPLQVGAKWFSFKAGF